MKTLRNHTILYDADCPMCNLYTRAFIKTGMLDENGREPYQQMPPEFCALVNRQRSVDEIALVNRTTGEVSYGINSMFTIIGNAYPLLKPLFSFKPFVTLMSKVYAFVSSNRKVIIPVKKNEAAINPTFKLRYRIAYLVFTGLVTSLILTAYARLLVPVMQAGSVYSAYMICGVQILVQGILIGFVDPTKRWDYLGNMMTISLAGSLLLLPMLLLNNLVPVNILVIIAYFMAVTAGMLLEHIRRSRLLGIGWSLTTGWITVILLVLLLIRR